MGSKWISASWCASVDLPEPELPTMAMRMGEPAQVMIQLVSSDLVSGLLT